MHLRRLVPVLLLPISLLAACGDDDESTVAGDASEATTTTASTDEGDGDRKSPFEPAPDHTLTIEDNGREIPVETGAVIDVVLESCPSCGYSWLQMGDAGTGGLELVEETQVDPDPNEEGETGGNVDHWFRFRTTSGGTTHITLGYFPPGEDAPEDVFDVVLQIAPEGDEVNDVVVFGPAENGTTVSVDEGSAFDIAVEQCIGCGYEWRLVNEPDPAVLTLTGEADTGGPEQVEGEPPMVGGMGEHVFHFEATGAGTTTIELGYFPPADDAPEETYTLTVEVR